MRQGAWEQPGTTSRTILAELEGAAAMTSAVYPNPEAIFYQQYEVVRRDEIVGVLLALFLGTFGIHHFYLRRTGLGILYCFFFWSGIPAILGFFECFFMPGRVREFNVIQAAGISAALGIPVPGWGLPVRPYGQPFAQPFTPPFTPPFSGPANAPFAAAPEFGTQTGTQSGVLLACPRCQRVNPPGAKFCSACGAAL
jgi:TM2 domain-containing membrane protein YozV